MIPGIKKEIKETKQQIKFLKELLKEFDSEWDPEPYQIIKARIRNLSLQIKAARRIMYYDSRSNSHSN